MTRRAWRTWIEAVCDADEATARPAMHLLRTYVLVDPAADPPAIVSPSNVLRALRRPEGGRP